MAVSPHTSPPPSPWQPEEAAALLPSLHLSVQAAGSASTASPLHFDDVQIDATVSPQLPEFSSMVKPCSNEDTSHRSSGIMGQLQNTVIRGSFFFFFFYILLKILLNEYTPKHPKTSYTEHSVKEFVFFPMASWILLKSNLQRAALVYTIECKHNIFTILAHKVQKFFIDSFFLFFQNQVIIDQWHLEDF